MSEGESGKLSRRDLLQGSVGAFVAASVGCGGGDETPASTLEGQSGGATGFPGWLSSPQNFAYAQQGVDEHAEIMAWRDA